MVRQHAAFAPARQKRLGFRPRCFAHRQSSGGFQGGMTPWSQDALKRPRRGGSGSVGRGNAKRFPLQGRSPLPSVEEPCPLSLSHGFLTTLPSPGKGERRVFEPLSLCQAIRSRRVFGPFELSRKPFKPLIHRFRGGCPLCRTYGSHKGREGLTCSSS